MMPGFKVPKDVLEHCSESKVFGVNVAQLYLGGKGSAFAAHIEDLNLSSMVSVTTGQKVHNKTSKF